VHRGVGKPSGQYLLSNEVWDVSSLHLEGAILCPEINRVGDASTASLIHHLCRLGPGDIELQVRILLPVSEQERELEEELVVSIAQHRNRLRAGVPVKTTFECLACSNQLLPVFKAIGIGFL